jgi:hypothetical protein
LDGFETDDPELRIDVLGSLALEEGSDLVEDRGLVDVGLPAARLEPELVDAEDAVLAQGEQLLVARVRDVVEADSREASGRAVLKADSRHVALEPTRMNLLHLHLLRPRPPRSRTAPPTRGSPMRSGFLGSERSHAHAEGPTELALVGEEPQVPV